MKRIALSLALLGALFVPALVRAATAKSSGSPSGVSAPSADDCPCSASCPCCHPKSK